MAVSRQDAWTEDEDLLLKEIVLQHIREGGTQLKAFEIVAEKLSRTAAACGFRWNSYLRKKYETDIELAKQERKKFRQQKEKKNSEKKLLHYEEAGGRSEITIDDVIAFLKSTQHQPVNNRLEEENKSLREKISFLEQKVEEFKNENEQLHEQLKKIENEFYAFIKMMEKVRERAGLKEEAEEEKMKHKKRPFQFGQE
ncbi:prespore-specific regulator [Aeribacillus composti]|uniref:RsfA family transcriptional regulator n=1 Tax=Aeribacillus composti TaxID=1868734 RepID=UPI001198E777|nr:RsfA family transcriptional regulator [Aeribacillus composti]TVZ83109.1 prespore-specific regulator [Aeribacillus composti]